MQRIAYSKKIICYLFILCIALTSTFSAYGECGVFSMQRQQTYCSRQTVQVDSFQNAKAEHYLHMIQTSFAKEDCRIEDGSANTMQKLNLIREQKTVSLSKFERICYCLTDCYARCVSIMHNPIYSKGDIDPGCSSTDRVFYSSEGRAENPRNILFLTRRSLPAFVMYFQIIQYVCAQDCTGK